MKLGVKCVDDKVTKRSEIGVTDAFGGLFVAPGGGQWSEHINPKKTLKFFGSDESRELSGPRPVLMPRLKGYLWDSIR